MAATFEVVGFHGTYHAIIGRPGCTKFMAIPNYTYLKLKMPGPKGVVTVSSSYEHAGSFEPAEGTKKISLDPNGSNDKALTISANLDPK